MALREDKAGTDVPTKGRGNRLGSGRNGLGAGAPMTASFIGLLMLGSIRPAEADDVAEQNGAVPGDDGDSLPVIGATPVFSGPMAATLTAAPQLAAGSVLTIGDYLEPMTVAQLSGNYALAELPGDEFTPLQPGAGNEAMSISTSVDADVSVALGAGAAVPETEAAAPVVDDDGNLDTPGQSMDGGDGNDTLIGTDLADRLQGGAGADTIFGGAGADVVFGGAGADELLGEAGNDELWGGEDDDHLDGGAGDDLLYGEAGDDDILGGAGHDRLEGGAGNDRLVGGDGSDRLTGGPGDDTLVIESVSDIAIEADEGPEHGGNDTLEVDAAFAENTKRDLGAFAPEGEVTFTNSDDLGAPMPEGVNGFRQQVDPDIENITLLGDADHDVIGGDGDNTIIGNDGDNQLYGGLGDDALWGGDGEDLLYGGEGDDILFGGEGDDIYLVGLAESGSDTIFDHQGSNLLRLDGADPGNLSARLDGSTLIFEQDGAEIVRIDDYTSKPDSFEGVEIDGKVVSIDEFLPKQPPVAPATPQSDLLGDYLDEPTDEPPSAASQTTELDLPQEAVVEPEPEPAVAASAVDPNGEADLLQAFMIDQEIWTTGDEQSLYALGDQAMGEGVGSMDEGREARA